MSANDRQINKFNQMNDLLPDQLSENTELISPSLNYLSKDFEIINSLNFNNWSSEITGSDFYFDDYLLWEILSNTFLLVRQSILLNSSTSLPENK